MQSRPKWKLSRRPFPSEGSWRASMGWGMLLGDFSETFKVGQPHQDGGGWGRV